MLPTEKDDNKTIELNLHELFIYQSLLGRYNYFNTGT